MNGRIRQAWPLGGVQGEELSRGEGRVGVLGWWDSLEREGRAAAYGLQESRQTPKPPLGIGSRTQALCRSSQVVFVGAIIHELSTSAHSRNLEALERSPMPVPPCPVQLMPVPSCPIQLMMPVPSCPVQLMMPVPSA